MKIIHEVNYTADEIVNTITTLRLLDEICEDDDASTEMKEKADTAFEALSDLLLYDPMGEKAYRNAGW